MKMKKGDHSKIKSKGVRRRKKKSIEYQMKSCLTWEYADDFCDINNWHESLQADDSDNNIVKAEFLKKEGDARDDSPDDDYISLGGNQYRVEQSCPNESPPKNPYLTEEGPVVKEDPIQPVEFSAYIVKEVSSEDQPQRAGSYFADIADKIIAEKPPVHGTPSFTTISDEDIGSSFENLQSNSFHVNCRIVKTKEKLTTEGQSHSDKRTFKCSQCPKEFTQSGHLSRHQRSHSGERPFECTTCGKTFASSSNLKIHLRTHTGDKPYRCTHCPKMFTQNAHLRSHRLIHSGVKAYKCQQCSKEFTLKDGLTTHMRTHSGIKPFECPHCPNTFAHSSNRRQHVLKYHTE